MGHEECRYFQSHHDGIKRNADDIQRLWGEEGISGIQKEINRMKWWVMCGMGAVIFDVLTRLGELALGH